MSDVEHERNARILWGSAQSQSSAVPFHVSCFLDTYYSTVLYLDLDLKVAGLFLSRNDRIALSVKGSYYRSLCQLVTPQMPPQ